MVWLFVLMSIAVTCVNAGQNMGSKGIATLSEGSACKNEYGGKTDVYRKKKNDNVSVINGTLDFPIDITDKLLLLFVVDKFEKGNWQKDFMTIRGKACEQINKLASGFIKRVNDFTKPAVGDSCPFKKGKYTLVNLLNKMDTSELNVPTVPYGKFRFTLQIIDKDMKPVFCVKFDPVIIDPK